MVKYILTSTVEGTTYTNAVLISANYDRSLAGFTKLFTEAKKDFPFLTNDEAQCRIVTKSTRFKDVPIIFFNIPNHSEHRNYKTVYGDFNKIDICF